ncbi:MAG: hypothetical protein IMZ52_09615 [Actinobacteria bacterium]|nr:hypothetical protein [Actinomycetota bacterium]
MEDTDIVHARKGGLHYHTNINCIMIVGAQYKMLEYKEIPYGEAKRRKLLSCSSCKEETGRIEYGRKTRIGT